MEPPRRRSSTKHEFRAISEVFCVRASAALARWVAKTRGFTKGILGVDDVTQLERKIFGSLEVKPTLNDEISISS